MLTILDYESGGFDLEAVKALFREYEAFLTEQLDFQDFTSELVALQEKYGPPGGNLYLALWENEANVAKRNAATPLRRIGMPDEIGGVAAFLAGPAASFITGQVIVADGGVTIA